MRIRPSAPFLLLWGSAVLLGACTSKDEAATPRFAVAGPASLRDVARLTGTVKPSDSVVIKSEVSGQVKKLLIRSGDFVKKGQLLMELDREQLELKHEQLVVAVESARLTLKAAERDLVRGQSQFAGGSVSADRVQDLEFARDRARLTLKNAEIDLRSNVKDLANTRIVSPRDGQVIALNVSEGEMATSVNSAAGGSSLAVLADPTDLKVVVEVSELDFPRLKLGQKVEVSTESRPDKLLPGKVSFIPPGAQASAANASVMVFKVEVTLDKGAKETDYAEVAGGMHRRGGQAKDGRGTDSAKGRHHRGVASKDSLNVTLVPGMTVNVDFVFLERKAEVAVPFGMVATGSDGITRTVWVRKAPAGKDTAKDAKDGQGPGKRKGGGPGGDFRPRRIQPGATDYKSLEVLGGLAAGDTVFAAPDTGAKGGKKGPGGPP